jgi:hypothetical protein
MALVILQSFVTRLTLEGICEKDEDIIYNSLFLVSSTTDTNSLLVFM